MQCQLSWFVWVSASRACDAHVRYRCSPSQTIGFTTPPFHFSVDAFSTVPHEMDIKLERCSVNDEKKNSEQSPNWESCYRTEASFKHTRLSARVSRCLEVRSVSCVSFDERISGLAPQLHPHPKVATSSFGLSHFTAYLGTVPCMRHCKGGLYDRSCFCSLCFCRHRSLYGLPSVAPPRPARHPMCVPIPPSGL